jgi:formyltetrahydrofolate deformylase
MEPPDGPTRWVTSATILATTYSPISTEPTFVALLHGPDQPGLVAKVASWIYERGGNILHAYQHRDMEAGIFFQRVEWVPSSPGAPASDPKSFGAFAGSLGMSANVTSSVHRPKVALFVSKADHCFHDLLLRWREGEFGCDIAAVISNHTDLESATRGYGVPFHHVAVAEASKAAAERRQLDLLRGLKVELVILARYMQVLSAGFLDGLGAPVINIHHSFLPAFAGGRPYHQAYERGVKLIGATAHYATAELDDGPIIQQDVARMTHRHSVSDLIRKGRDLEKIVLAQAVRWHLESRVLVYGRKTVVFD